MGLNIDITGLETQLWSRNAFWGFKNLLLVILENKDPILRLKTSILGFENHLGAQRSCSGAESIHFEIKIAIWEGNSPFWGLKKKKQQHNHFQAEMMFRCKKALLCM